MDYLRYQAFAGHLRDFFEGSVQNYVDPEDTTGQHLRYSPEWLSKHWNYSLIKDLYIDREYSCAEERFFDLINYVTGIRRFSDDFSLLEFRLGTTPPAYTYKHDYQNVPELEIIIDIHPERWSKRYSEKQSYEGTAIIYRRSYPAKPHFATGDRLIDRRESDEGYGTLCGVFETPCGTLYGLTCGHVASRGGEVLLKKPRKNLGLLFRPIFTANGTTEYHTICEAKVGVGRIEAELDAALIRFDRPGRGIHERQAELKTISTVLQEEPVIFRGATRLNDVTARVSAITVRKSLDLLNDGQLVSVGDVLMLGHRQAMYFVRPVSRRGDSGAAVRQGFGSGNSRDYWLGMILGGDQQNSYATHAEFLWGWAAAQTGSHDLGFFFEI